jgi:hypothetical protein
MVNDDGGVGKGKSARPGIFNIIPGKCLLSRCIPSVQGYSKSQNEPTGFHKHNEDGLTAEKLTLTPAPLHFGEGQG